MWIAPVTLPGRVTRLEPLESRHAADLLAVARALPNGVPFAIIDQATGRAIGRTTYMEIRPEDRGVEIGRTWIGRAFHGTRVNPEIKYLMLQHAFERLEPTALRVQLTTGGSNLHSQAAIAKLGAVREGVLRKSRVVPGGMDPSAPKVVRDTVIYSIVDDDWPAVRHRLEQRLQWTSSQPAPIHAKADPIP